MKKRLLMIACAAALLLGLRAFAAGGTSGDPLISVSYLMNTFFPKLQAAITQRAQAETETLRNDALDRVDALGNAKTPDLSMAGWTYNPHYQTMDVKRGDKLTLYAGSGLVWILGRGTAEAGLVDVTTADEPAAGAELGQNHRYLNGLEQPVSVTVLTDAASLAVEGYYTLTASNEEVTPFVDLSKSTDWFYDAALYTYEKGLLIGTADNVFDPHVPMNRAMLVTVLYRMSGYPEVKYAGEFPDVPAGQWYTEPIEWAAKVGIVEGYEDGTFRPHTYLTRENTMLILQRFMGEYLGIDVSQRANLSRFDDEDKVHFWAADAVPWAVSMGMIPENSTSLRPAEDAIRAEVAYMLKGMLSWIGLG